MAIAIDTSKDLGGNGGSGTTLTVSYTCSGNNRILFVAAFDSNADHITGVTYAGVSLTKIGSSLLVPTTTIYMSLWYLVAPATGANNIVVTSSVNNETLSGLASSYTGVLQTSPIDGGSSGTTGTVNTGTSITTTLTLTNVNDWLICVAGWGTGTLSTSSGVIRVQPAGVNYDGIADSNVAVGSGSQSFTITNGSNTVGAQIMSAFSPAPSVGSLIMGQL